MKELDSDMHEITVTRSRPAKLAFWKEAGMSLLLSSEVCRSELRARRYFSRLHLWKISSREALDRSRRDDIVNGNEPTTYKLTRDEKVEICSHIHVLDPTCWILHGWRLLLKYHIFIKIKFLCIIPSSLHGNKSI